MDQSGPALRFWLKRTLAALASGFFLWFGIDLLRAAYRRETPLEFIALFFSSNLIILISAVLGLGFVLSMIRRVRNGPESPAPEETEENGPDRDGKEEDRDED